MSSTAADKIKANAERLRAKTPATPAPAPSQPAEPSTSVSTPASQSPAQAVVRQKTVRRTVDLSPVQHRALDKWQSELADRLGLAHVTGQDVMSALVDQLLADDQLAAHIAAAIASKA